MDLKFLDERGPQPNHPHKIHLFLILWPCALAVVAGGAFFFLRFAPKDPANTQSTVESLAGASSLLSSADAVTSTPRPESSAPQKQFQQSGDWKLILVDSKIALPGDYQPQIVSYGGIQMDQRIEPYFLDMKAAAAKENITLWLSDGYRSADAQEKLFQREVDRQRSSGLAQSAAEEAAQQTVSKPGYSEHNTGLALDFNGGDDAFATTDAYEWLQKHAAEYGFILRFPEEKESVTGVSFEPWFYRYVGKENAAEISSRQLCLEEYLKAPWAAQ